MINFKEFKQSEDEKVSEYVGKSDNPSKTHGNVSNDAHKIVAYRKKKGSAKTPSPSHSK